MNIKARTPTPDGTTGRTQCATLDTPDFALNLDFDYFRDAHNRTLYLGRWTAGLASGHLSLENLPEFSTQADAGSLEGRDVRAANMLLSTSPRKCFDALMTARQVAESLSRAERDAINLGYTGAALKIALKEPVKTAFAALESATNDVFTVSQRLNKALETAASAFADTGESEIQTVMYDTAIVQRLVPPTPAENAQLQCGHTPARFTDGRLVQALLRVPMAAHGLDKATVDAIKAGWLASQWPCVTQAAGVLKPMLQEARAALASVVPSCGIFAGITPDECFARIGAWLKATASA